ncbi:hypothetical protein M8494_36075 [Serratia ureilytica]
MRVAFNAPADADNAQLVKAQASAVLGLRLLDAHGRDVRLGSRGAPLRANAGSNVLSYRLCVPSAPWRR